MIEKLMAEDTYQRYGYRLKKNKGCNLLGRCGESAGGNAEALPGSLTS